MCKKPCAAIDIKGLQFSYGKAPVLEGLCLAVKSGESTALLGSNGSGKSTLLRCILGVLKGCTGEIRLMGRDARQLSPRETAQLCAYVPQQHSTVFPFTVLEMTLMGTVGSVGLFESPRTEQKQAAYSALESVGMAMYADRPFTRLSGGERRLVLFARALAQCAPILILDEPTAGLDLGNSALVMAMVRKLAGNGYTVLFSTHDPQQALTYADHAVALCSGRIVADGSPRAIIGAELVEQLYDVNVEFFDIGNKRIMLSPDIRIC